MKTLFLLLALVPFIATHPLSAQNQKAEKAEQLARLFQETRTLIESNRFKVVIDRVYPQNGMDMTRFNPRGEIVVDDTLVKGNLPFFGRAYSLPYGEGGGIEFEGPMIEKTVKIKQRKKNKMILYHFSVRGQNDVYQISIDIAAGGNCSVDVSSNNRTHIAYTGNAVPWDEK